MSQFTVFIIIFMTLNLVICDANHDYCTATYSNKNDNCYSKSTKRYLFYDVNPPEGFNLRRDVYLRMVQLSLELSQIGQWTLVLPPWTHLPHWRSPKQQDLLPWSTFFDVPSLNKFAPVAELFDVYDELGTIVIDHVFVLQNYKDMFTSGKFEDKFEVTPCIEPLRYHREKNNVFEGEYWGFDDIHAKKVDCLSFHGPANSLITFLNNSQSNLIMLDHAEVVLHNNFGDVKYWQARRSMRFSNHLIQIAMQFRTKHLDSTDKKDGIRRIKDWTNQSGSNSKQPVGGPYLGVHLRRQDFVRSRMKTIPSIVNAAQQIINLLNDLNLTIVFVATDAASHEREQLRRDITSQGYKVFYFGNRDDLLDGEIAIVEQIICSHSRWFVGSYESTYSFRIQEEREILGFPSNSTFNRLCGDNENNKKSIENTKFNCVQSSVWRIKY